MILVKVPHAFFAEREYLCSVIFKEFIGIDFTIEANSIFKNTVEIEFAGKKIIINDSFFSKASEELGYLFKEFLPVNVQYVQNEYTKEKDIPLLYGTNDIITVDNTITCNHDIFASIFFMLTRWEEYVVKEYDYLERFPAHSSLAVHYGFLHRPVVNEWVEMLKNMIKKLSPSIVFCQPQHFEIVFTHDIDLLNAPTSLREFAKDILKRRSLKAFAKRISYLVHNHNPYDVFDYFMDTSERHNTVSRFYFMTGHNVTGKDGEPYNRTPLYKKTLERIKERKHIIGFHPSLLSYNDPVMFKQEKMQLEKDLGQPVKEGRQHALRFDLPGTWNIWEAEGMELDSTMGYSAKEGFRCGTGNTFTVFDIIQRRPLALKQMPLVLMDTTLNVNRKLSVGASKEIISEYMGVAKKYDMPITLLFHNLVNDSIDWNGWKRLYDELFWN